MSSILRPDSKGRVTLGKLIDRNVSGFKVEKDSEGRLVLEPLVEIPARETWLFDSQDALASVQRGIQDARSGRTRPLGSFAKFAGSDSNE